MGLQVWLPLNGDLDNQGLANVTVSNNGATVNTAGKIGSCYNFVGGAALYLGNNVFTSNPSELTVCAWMKLNEGYSTNSGLHLITINNNELRICLSKDGAAIRVLYKYNSGGSGYSSNTLSGALQANVWYHIAVSIKSGESIRIYINGVLDAERDISSLSLPTISNLACYVGSNTNNGNGEPAKGDLNDFRIYDHCLSPREVKEISKGLVLHYPLSMPGQENLYIGSKDFSGTWTNQAYWKTDADTYSGFTVKKKSSTWGGLAQNVPCSNGDIFTISFYAKVDSGGNILSVHRSSLGNVTTGLKILGGNFTSTNYWVANNDDGTTWKRYWATVQITSSDITYLQWRIENSVADKFLYVCGMKLERGSRPTHWIPNPADAEYSTLGFDDGIEYDVSGFKNNGTKNGTITPSTDTPRYGMSYKFDGNTSYINAGNISRFFVGTPFSISFWIKSLENGTRGVIFSSYGLPNGTYFFGLEINSSNASYCENNLRFDWCGADTYSSADFITYNEWVHVVVTYDGSTIKMYKNGVLTDSSTRTLQTIQTGNSYYLARDRRTGSTAFDGYLSDFRIYSTCLSDNDIISLYNAPISLSNTGFLLTQGEYVEV